MGVLHAFQAKRAESKSPMPSYIGVHGDKEEYEVKRDFMLDLTRAMVEYGLPSHRLEYHLETVSECLGVKSTYAVLPGLILMSFSPKKRSSDTFFLKISSGYSMGRLTLVNDLCFDLVHGGMTIEEARSRLAEIKATKNLPEWTTLITFPIIAFTICATVFGGTWGDSLIAPIAAVPVALISLIGSRVPNIGYLCDFLSTFVVTIVTTYLRSALQSHFACMSTLKIMFSAIAIPLPGLPLTIGVIELSTRNIVSGTVRIFHAIFTALLLGFGYSVAQGLTAKVQLDAASATCPDTPINLLWAIPFLPLLAFTFNLVFNPRKYQHLVMMFTQIIGFLITTLLPKLTGLQNSAEALTIVAAFAVGVIANTYSRFTRDVAIAPILGGILLMVPGSLGVRGSLGFFAQDNLDGTTISVKMLMISVSLSIGLFVATLVVWPIRGPRAVKYITV
eukprot:jgi/Hompol1/3658/HPOL_003311-RA